MGFESIGAIARNHAAGSNPPAPAPVDAHRGRVVGERTADRTEEPLDDVLNGFTRMEVRAVRDEAGVTAIGLNVSGAR
jgi:hypothetical protein